MSKNTQITPLRPEEVGLTAEQIDLIKTAICKGATDNELRLFLYQCKRMGLDPMARQVFAVKRWDSKERREVMTIQTSIDGYRTISQRTKEMDGYDGPYYAGEDGVWKDAWLDKNNPPFVAKMDVYRKGCSRPYRGIVYWKSVAQKTKEGKLTAFWQNHAETMIAKCAEAQGLRKAFPIELGNTYIEEEMHQADQQEAEFHQHNAAVAQQNIQVLANLRDEKKEQEAAMAVQIQEIAAKIDKRCTPGLTQSLNRGLETSGRIKPGACWQSATLKDLQSINRQFEKYAARALDAFPPINVIGPEELVDF